jgi:hypothetical protein
MIPHIKENPRNRQTPKGGRKRWFNEAIHVLRDERSRRLPERTNASGCYFGLSASSSDITE